MQLIASTITEYAEGILGFCKYLKAIQIQDSILRKNS